MCPYKLTDTHMQDDDDEILAFSYLCTRLHFYQLVIATTIQPPCKLHSLAHNVAITQNYYENNNQGDKIYLSL